MIPQEKTLSSLLREARNVEPVASAEDARQLIETQRIVHKVEGRRAPMRTPIAIAVTAVLSVVIGAVVTAFFVSRDGAVLPFAPGGNANELHINNSNSADSAAHSSLGNTFYRYFSYDTLFERKLRALPPGSAAGTAAAATMLELTADELADIGVRVEDGRVELYKVCFHVPTLAERYVIGPKRIEFPNMKPIEEHPSVYVPKFEPLLISDDRGMWRRIVVERKALDPALVKEYEQAPPGEESAHSLVLQMSEQGAEKLRRRINTLIPILVRTGQPYTEADRRARRFRPDVILWYEPTSEFLEQLPPRIASQLRVELAASELLAAANRINPDATIAVQRKPDLRGGEHEVQVREERAAGVVAEYVDRVVGGEKYLDVWRTSAGAIEGTYLYPNPAPEGRTTLHYKLLENRLVSVTLFDIWGRRIRELVSPESRTAGEGEFALGCGDLPEGMYIVVLQTDKGEQSVQRIMVE